MPCIGLTEPYLKLPNLLGFSAYLLRYSSYIYILDELKFLSMKVVVIGNKPTVFRDSFTQFYSIVFLILLTLTALVCKQTV